MGDGGGKEGGEPVGRRCVGKEDAGRDVYAGVKDGSGDASVWDAGESWCSAVSAASDASLGGGGVYAYGRAIKEHVFLPPPAGWSSACRSTRSVASSANFASMIFCPGMSRAQMVWLWSESGRAVRRAAWWRRWMWRVKGDVGVDSAMYVDMELGVGEEGCA